MNWVDHPLARPVAPAVAVAEAVGAGFTHAAAGEVRDPAARGFEGGGPADLLGPCPELAALTGMALEAGVERLTDDEIVGVMRAARRVQSWQAAVELACVDELADRRQAVVREGGPSGRERAVAEIGCALTVTGRSAEALVDLAAGLRRMYIEDALARGSD